MLLFLTEMPTEAKEKLLFAGLQLFTLKGYKNTSVLDIVEFARVSKTTFYQHFKSKEEIMATLFKEVSDEIITEVKSAIDSEKRLTYKAYAGIYRYLEICFEKKHISKIHLVESVGVSKEVEQIRQESHQQLANLIFYTVQSELSALASEKGMRIVSQAMVGAINEVVMQNVNKSENTKEELEEIARLLNRVVIGAFVNLSL